ncbi:calcium-binding protein, partial [Methylophilus flavus]
MNLQYSGVDSIALSNFSSALSTNAQSHYTLFAIIDIEYMAFSDWNATNTYASGNEYNTGYQYTLTGNHFIDDTPLLTVKSINLTSLHSNENFLISSPGVTVNYNTGGITGGINKFEYTNFTTGVSYSILGSFGISADGSALRAGTITAISFSSNTVDSYTIKGSLTTDLNGIITGGTLNEITLIDSSENTLKASGFTISWAQYQSLTIAHSSLSDLLNYINSESNLAGNDNILGGNQADNLYSGAGNDIIDGGLGADLMRGGKGNDTYIVDNIGDVVTELENEGIDLVKANATHTLSANVENLTLTDGSVNGGSATINGTGNTLANTITGNAGDNILDGGAGIDKLIGGLGDDIYKVD